MTGYGAILAFLILIRLPRNASLGEWIAARAKDDPTGVALSDARTIWTRRTIRPELARTTRHADVSGAMRMTDQALRDAGSGAHPRKARHRSRPAAADRGEADSPHERLPPTASSRSAGAVRRSALSVPGAPLPSPSRRRRGDGSARIRRLPPATRPRSAALLGQMPWVRTQLSDLSEGLRQTHAAVRGSSRHRAARSLLVARFVRRGGTAGTLFVLSSFAKRIGITAVIPMTI